MPMSDHADRHRLHRELRRAQGRWNTAELAARRDPARIRARRQDVLVILRQLAALEGDATWARAVASLEAMLADLHHDPHAGAPRTGPEPREEYPMPTTANDLVYAIFVHDAYHYVGETPETLEDYPTTEQCDACGGWGIQRQGQAYVCGDYDEAGVTYLGCGAHYPAVPHPAAHVVFP